MPAPVKQREAPPAWAEAEDAEEPLTPPARCQIAPPAFEAGGAPHSCHGRGVDLEPLAASIS